MSNEANSQVAAVNTATSVEKPPQAFFPFDLPDGAGKMFELAASKDGLGGRCKSLKQVEIAKNFGLDAKNDKTALTFKQREIRSAMLKRALAFLVGQGDEWVLERLSGRKDKKGKRHLTIGVMDDPRVMMGDDELCEQVYPSCQFPDMKHEEKLEKLLASRERQVKQQVEQAEATVELEAEKE